MRIAFLGTGGSYPSRERNTSSVAVRYKGDVILFDCGEGTQRQLMLSSVSFMQIKTVCITHFHGDHFLGLAGLVQTMQMNQRKDPLEILVPPGGKGFVEQFLVLGHFKPNYPIRIHEVPDGSKRSYDGYSIATAKMNHPVPTVGFRFDEAMKPGRFDLERARSLGVPEGPLFARLQDGEPVTVAGRKVYPEDVMGPPRSGHSFAYLTDTGPAENLAPFAKEVDVLMMESTADDSLTQMANQYGHCAASQTAGVAKEAGVGQLYIIHLSARYKEKEPIESQARAVFPKSEVARDLQEVDFPWG